MADAAASKAAKELLPGARSEAEDGAAPLRPGDHACEAGELHGGASSTGEGLVARQEALERRNICALSVLFIVYLGYRSGCLVVLPLLSKELLKEDLQDAEYSPLYQLPFAIWFTMDVLLATPNAVFMRRCGRRQGFLFGACGSCLGSLLAFAVLRFCRGPRLAFVLLNACIAVMSTIGMTEFVRFAAAEVCTRPERKSVVVSRVVSGGAILSMVGPLSASLATSLGGSGRTQDGYALFFLGAAGCSLLGILAAASLKLPPVDAVAPGSPPAARLQQILRRPAVSTAIMAQVAVQFAMIAPMSAVPLRMQGHFPGMHAADLRISSCIMLHTFCMFAPGFFTGDVIARFGLMPVMSTGLFCQASCSVAAILGSRLWDLYLALAVLGVGWNFAFVSSTMILLDSHTPAERTKVTSTNETIRFAANGIAVLVSSTVPWEHLNWVCLGLVVLVALVLMLRWKPR